MNLRHLGVLVRKEFQNSTGNFFIVYTIVVPLLLSLFVTAVFGSLFSEEPKLGVYSAQDSALATEITAVDYLNTRTYDDADALEAAVESGAVDVGLVVPADFDTQLGTNTVTLTTYVWGESQANHRATVSAALNNVIYDLAAANPALTINTVEIGDPDTLGWEERLLPLIMIIVVIIGGMVVPASSLIDEREKRTIRALITSPITLQEVFVAKGLLGVVLSVTMGVLVLVINQAFGSQPVLLVLILALGATFAAEFGLLLGTFIADMKSFFATIKAMGLLLYAPAIVLMFPSLPQWIAQVFPTYYIIAPIIDITINDHSATDVLPELGVLMVFLVVGAALLYRFGRGDRKYAM